MWALHGICWLGNSSAALVILRHSTEVQVCIVYVFFIHFKEQLRNLATFLLLLANSKPNNVFLFHFEMNARKLTSDIVGAHFHKRKPMSPNVSEESATGKDCE